MVGDQAVRSPTAPAPSGLRAFCYFLSALQVTLRFRQPSHRRRTPRSRPLLRPPHPGGRPSHSSEMANGKRVSEGWVAPRPRPPRSGPRAAPQSSQPLDLSPAARVPPAPASLRRRGLTRDRVRSVMSCSKARVSSACRCVCSAIFSLNFRGLALPEPGEAAMARAPRWQEARPQARACVSTHPSVRRPPKPPPEASRPARPGRGAAAAPEPASGSERTEARPAPGPAPPCPRRARPPAARLPPASGRAARRQPGPARADRGPRRCSGAWLRTRSLWRPGERSRREPVCGSRWSGPLRCPSPASGMALGLTCLV